MKKLPTALMVPSSSLKVWVTIAPPLDASVPAFGSEVCDGVAFGAMTAYGLWRCGLRTSKSGAYGWPEAIAYSGMPGNGGAR